MNAFTYQDTMMVSDPISTPCLAIPCEAGVAHEAVARVSTVASNGQNIKIHFGGWTGSTIASLMVLSMECDTILNYKCVDRSADSLTIPHADQAFVFWYRTEWPGKV